MKNILILGASSGIGFSLSKLLEDEGCNVYGTYFKNSVQSTSKNVQFHYCDVREETSLSFLPDVLDGIVYCPGSILLRPFSRIKPAQFMDDYQLQVIGAIRIIQQCLPRLQRSTNASIVLFSTVAVKQGFPFHTLVSTSKGAIEGLTRSLAAELAPTIRVNCIAPSITDTPLAEKWLNTEAKRESMQKRNPMKKIGQPEDLAHMALYLLSDKAKWMTAQTLHVDGGVSNISSN